MKVSIVYCQSETIDATTCWDDQYAGLAVTRRAIDNYHTNLLE